MQPARLARPLSPGGGRSRGPREGVQHGAGLDLWARRHVRRERELPPVRGRYELRECVLLHGDADRRPHLRRQRGLHCGRDPELCAVQLRERLAGFLSHVVHQHLPLLGWNQMPRRPLHMRERLASLRRRAASILLAFLLLAAPWPATADRRDGTAREQFRKAEKAFSVGAFDKALEHYQKAYELEPLPGLLFNMGQCYRNLGNPERAIFFYERFLQLAKDRSQRDMVEALIADQRERLTPAARVVPEPPAPSTPSGPPLSTVPPPVPRPLLDEPALQTSGPAPAESAASAKRPLYRRWWVWAATGVMLGSASAYLLVTRRRDPPEGNLGSIDRR
jgi:tetratricopeptide (TPR) repeat protein